MSHKTNLNALYNREISSPARESKPEYPNVQALASHYTGRDKSVANYAFSADKCGNSDVIGDRPEPKENFCTLKS
jgi:hypothetical protein